MRSLSSYLRRTKLEKTTLEKLDNNKVKLTIHVGQDSFEEGMQKSYLKNRKSISIPGFRKGKVPRKVMEQYFGESILYEDAINEVFPPAYDQAVKETGIEPVDRPELDIVQIGSGQDFIFTAEVTVKPEVELGQYKGFEVDRVEYIVTDEEVEERIKQTLEQNARWVSVEDRPVKTGDRVILDYSGSIDGELFEGGTAEKQNLEIGSGHFIPGFEEQMVGMELGEEKDLKVTFPEEYHAEELKGKEATFHVKLHEIKEKELPDLDDEFAKDVSEFDTLDEYRADIKQKLEKNAEERSNTELKNNLIDLAVNNAKVDIPDVMVDFELDNMLRDIDNQLRYNGLNIESYLKIANTSIDDFRAQYKDDAYNRVKTQLVIEAIGKAENIEVSEEDYEKQYELLAKQYNQEVETIKKSLQGGLEHLENSIIAEKTIELLVDEAKVTVKEALVKEDVQDK
ncbi:MAG: trigger factor [Clostridiales bacterium]|nr:trigger factor [Clostridiales bacterium]